MPAEIKKLSHREAKKEECRKAIAQAAVQLFEEKGYEATTMDEIARAAHVSRPTVFNYFPRKEDILWALGTMLRQRLSEQAQVISQESAEDPLAAIGRILVTVASGFAEYPETSQAFHLYKMQDVHARRRAGETPDNEMGEQRQLILSLIERGQAKRLIRSDFTALELMHHLMIGLFASTIGPWIHGEHSGEPLPNLVARHFNLYVQGIAP